MKKVYTGAEITATHIYRGTLVQKQETGESLGHFLRLYSKYFNGKMTYDEFRKKKARAISFTLHSSGRTDVRWDRQSTDHKSVAALAHPPSRHGSD